MYNLGDILQHKQTKRLIMLIDCCRLNGTLGVKNVRDENNWTLKPKYFNLYEKIDISNIQLGYPIHKLILYKKSLGYKNEKLDKLWEVFKNELKKFELLSA